MKTQKGFSLLEVAIAMVLMALLLGGGMMGMTAVNDLRRYAQTSEELGNLKSLLLNYAAVNGKFPCPSYETNPLMPGYGLPAAKCSNPTQEGFFPWRLFGVRAGDVWGNQYRYRLDRNFAASATLKTSFAGGDHLRVKNSAGAFLAVPDITAAIVFSVGKNGTPDGENGSYECQLKPVFICIDGVYQSDSISSGFDDSLTWITSYDLNAYLTKFL